MANDGWFKCENCGNMVKVLVPDHVKVLTTKCENCGGTYKKSISIC